MTSQVVEASIIIASNNPFRDYSTLPRQSDYLAYQLFIVLLGIYKEVIRSWNVNKKPEDSIMLLFIWFEENI